MEKIFENFKIFCKMIAASSLAAIIFELLSKIGGGPFSATFEFISVALKTPMSMLDLFIEAFCLGEIIACLGIVFWVLEKADC